MTAKVIASGPGIVGVQNLVTICYLKMAFLCMKKLEYKLVAKSKIDMIFLNN